MHLMAWREAIHQSLPQLGRGAGEEASREQALDRLVVTPATRDLWTVLATS